MNTELLECLSRLNKNNSAYIVGTVVEVVGSTSAKTGSKILIDADGGVITGWVGGGCAESTVCAEALESLDAKQPRFVDIDMDDEVLGAGMPCGGHMRVFVEPVIANPTVWIMGHGAVAEHLCHIASLSGFQVIVNDSGAVQEKFVDANRLILDDIDYSELKPCSDDFVVVATQHKGDHESITRALDSGAQHIALIASRKRARLVLDYLKDKQYSDEDLLRVLAPCGINIGARTPVEIALSVMAEIVMIRRDGNGGRLKDSVNDVDQRSAGTLSKTLNQHA